MRTMRKAFDYETLTYESRVMIHDTLAETTMKHITTSNGLFEQLEFDPARHPSQILETVHLKPVPTTPEEIDFLATSAAPQLYPFLVEEVRQNTGLMNNMNDYLRHGESVHILDSPHLKMDDLPELGAAIGTQMDESHWQEQNGIIISRGVSTIGAFGMAASEVVEKPGHVFMSFPRTDSIERVKQSLVTKGIGVDIEALITTNNVRMKEAIKDWKGHKLFHKIGRQALGKSLQIALEGSTPKIETLDGRVTSVRLNTIGKGTLDLIKGDYVLPVVLWSDPEDPILRFGPIQRVSNMEQLTNIHHWQAHTLARALGLSADKVQIDQGA